MGRRSMGGGPPKSSSDFDRILRHHIESASKKNRSLSADVDQLVDHLRSAYPRLYSRHKLAPLRSRVSRILGKVSPSPKRLIEDDDVDSYENAPSKKKLRKVDEREEKLRLIEDRHARNALGDKNVMSGGSSSSVVSASDGTGDSSSGEASTSEDAVYGEEYEPEFDLMKSLMRQNLLRNGKKETKQEDVELEVMNDKDVVKTLGLSDGRKELTMADDGRPVTDGMSSDGGDDGFHAPTFKDFGGMDSVIEELNLEVVVPLSVPEIPRHLGVKPISGILLHGPPGCGKTTLAHAIANETGLPFYKISATELVSGVSGASEENLRDLFDKALKTAPSVVFIDEIDAIASKRENLNREMERRIVTQLMTCMDASHRTDKAGYVLVIGATNRPDALDPALRRGGRFDREIHLGVPDEYARAQILSVLTKNLKVEGSFDLNKVARSTPGFVGSDLAALTNKAGNLALKRIIHKRKVELSSSSSKEYSYKEVCEDWKRNPWSDDEWGALSITMSDFEEAAKIVRPSLTREGFSIIPRVKWDDVGGLQSLREEFDTYIVRRIKSPEDYSDFGVDLETGFLLFGPPGCGKTLIAKAVANEAEANFIHVKGPELLNKYVGESEQAVRTMFTRARTCSPCILFFDEIDALTTKRGKEGGWVVERVLNQLLIELDGAEERKGVFVIGATNRPEVIDPAILRPGRLGKLIYVPLPSPNERGMILKALSRNKPLDSDVDLMAIASDAKCENFSGADLSFLVKEASMAALNDDLALRRDGRGGDDNGKKSIKGEHFRRALERVSPSVSESENRYYKSLSQKLRRGRIDSLDASSISPPTYSYS